MFDAHFCARQQKSVAFDLASSERTSIQSPRRHSAPGRHSIQACLSVINPPKLATVPARHCSAVPNLTSGRAPRSSSPCQAEFESWDWMIDDSRLCIWLWQGRCLKIRLILRFVKRWWTRRLDRQRVHDIRQYDGRLTGVQNDLLRPFVG
jgi:hypothetical protein